MFIQYIILNLTIIQFPIYGSSNNDSLSLEFLIKYSEHSLIASYHGYSEWYSTLFTLDNLTRSSSAFSMRERMLQFRLDHAGPGLPWICPPAILQWWRNRENPLPCTPEFSAVVQDPLLQQLRWTCVCVEPAWMVSWGKRQFLGVTLVLSSVTLHLCKQTDKKENIKIFIRELICELKCTWNY